MESTSIRFIFLTYSTFLALLSFLLTHSVRRRVLNKFFTGSIKILSVQMLNYFSVERKLSRPLPAMPPKQDKSKHVKADLRTFPWIQEVSWAEAELKVFTGIFYLLSSTFDIKLIPKQKMF